MNGRSPVLARSGEVIEQERRLPPLAHRVISWRRSNSVAFGAERT
jgi:hypothetical protein